MMYSDDVSGACDCCIHACQNRRNSWYCEENEEEFFPDAPWDGINDYEPTSCPSFEADPDCYSDEDWIWQLQQQFVELWH